MLYKERRKADRQFRRISKVGKFIRKHICKELGNRLIDWNDTKWADSYNR